MDVIALPLQGGCIFLFQYPGRRLRLCPGLICYGLSGRIKCTNSRGAINRAPTLEPGFARIVFLLYAGEDARAPRDTRAPRAGASMSFHN